MQLGVEYLVRNLANVQGPAQQFRDFNRRGAHEHRPPGVAQLLDFVNHRVVLLSLGFKDQIVAVLALGILVLRNHRHLELVDFPEFASLGFCRTGHARQLVVHSKVVLQRNRGIGLGRGLDGHALLGFNGLVQAVRIAPSVHNPAGLFVNNLDFLIHDHVFHVFLKERVGL